VIANDNLRRSAFIFQILRFLPQTSSGVNAIVRTNSQQTIEHNMGTNPRVSPNAHLRTDHGSRTDDNPIGELCSGINNRHRMDLSGAIICDH
jgi:hypothetical protein